MRGGAAPRPGPAGAAGEQALTFEGLAIDPKTRLVTVRGEERALRTAKEFDLLLLLTRHPRQVFAINCSTRCGGSHRSTSTRHRDRARAPAPRKDRSRPDDAALHRDRLGRRLQV